MRKKINIDLPVMIAGKGISGQAVYDLLLELKISKDNILFCDPKNEPDLLDTFLNQNPKTVVVSPGISLKTAWLQKLLKSGCKLSSELEIATFFLTTEKIVAVTGSVGKSTTAALISAGMQNSKLTHFLGGNFGIPLSRYVLEKIKTEISVDWLVLEISSYQLENYKNLSTDYSIFTYLTPNHLERYESLSDYYASKFFLHNRTSHMTFINSNSPDLVNYFNENASEKSYQLCSSYSSNNLPEIFVGKYIKPNLIGKHNLENIGLVFQFANYLNFPMSFYLGVMNYSGLPHRLQKIYDFDNIVAINDSKATTIESVKLAVQTITNENPKKIWLLLGGRDKNLPWAELKNILTSNIECILFGECATLIQQSLQLKTFKLFLKLENALDYVIKNVQQHEAILLSPGGTSLDEFKNFEDRGEFFTNYLNLHIKKSIDQTHE